MKLFLSVVMLLPFFSAYAIEKQERIVINAELAQNTCAISITPISLTFPGLRAENVVMGNVEKETVDIIIKCSWPASGVSLKFIPALGSPVNTPELMETGITGVGLSLEGRFNSPLSSIPYNKIVPIESNGNKDIQGKIYLKPVKIPGQQIVPGQKTTNLRIEVSYD